MLLCCLTGWECPYGGMGSTGGGKKWAELSEGLKGVGLTEGVRHWPKILGALLLAPSAPMPRVKKGDLPVGVFLLPPPVRGPRPLANCL